MLVSTVGKSRGVKGMWGAAGLLGCHVSGVSGRQEVTFEMRTEGGEVGSRADIWGRTFQAEGTACV